VCVCGCSSCGMSTVDERRETVGAGWSVRVHGIDLQYRAAHPLQSTDVRQIERKPQPPIALRIVHFR
jgi:hypothetical protein